jgi:signal transduction histidine kinase
MVPTSGRYHPGMSAASDTQHATSFPRGIAREVTPLSIWGGDTLIYKSIITLSGLAMPVIAAVNWYLRGSLSWPQLAAAGAIFLGATLCFMLAKIGRRDIAAALLIGVLWLTVTIYCFNSGYGMHSAAAFVYLPLVLYTALFFGLGIATVELALTIAVLVIMYVSEERGHLGGASVFAAKGTNFNFLFGVILTSIGTLAVGVVYHRRVEREAARVVAEAEQRRLAMEQAQSTQVQLQTALAKLQQLNDELAVHARFRDVEMARAKRDIDLYHDVVSKDIPVSLQALREAIASPDEKTEAILQRELGRIESVVDALEELGRHGLPALRRERIDLSALAHEEVRGAGRTFAQVRFDVDAGLRADGDRRLLAALLRHLVKRAAGACRAEPEPLVHVGSGSHEGRAVFFVRDNGPGMKSEQREKLFRPFERGNPPSGTEDDTVDIGIVSARRIVERHGGELVIESQPGRGTTVFFSLPAA